MAHNLALVATALLALVLIKGHQWYLAKYKHSPSGDPNPAGGVKPQVGAPVTPVDPTLGEGGQEGKTIYRPDSAVSAWLAEQAPKRGTNDLIREATRRFGKSASTIKRRLRELRKAGPQ